MRDCDCGALAWQDPTYIIHVCIFMWKSILKKCDFVFVLTSKVRSVRQLHLLVELGDDTRDAVLNEVHLLPDRAFSDYVVVGLKDLKLQLAQHPRHEVGVRVGKQRHGGHKLTAIEVDNFLAKKKERSRHE